MPVRPRYRSASKNRRSVVRDGWPPRSVLARYTSGPITAHRSYVPLDRRRNGEGIATNSFPQTANQRRQTVVGCRRYSLIDN